MMCLIQMKILEMKWLVLVGKCSKGHHWRGGGKLANKHSNLVHILL